MISIKGYSPLPDCSCYIVKGAFTVSGVISHDNWKKIANNARLLYFYLVDEILEPLCFSVLSFGE